MRYLVYFVILVTLSFNVTLAQKVTLFEGKNFTGTSYQIPDNQLKDGMEIPLARLNCDNKISSIKLNRSPNHINLELIDDPGSAENSKAILFSCADLSQIELDKKITLIKIHKIVNSGFKAFGFINRNDQFYSVAFDEYKMGYRVFGDLNEKLNYFAVDEKYALILWENADDAHDKLGKGFGETFVIMGQGLNVKQAVGPKIRNKVSYFKAVLVEDLFENLK